MMPRQNPQQFASPYPSWPHHPEFPPPTPLPHPYPTTGTHWQAGGQFLQPQSSVQMLSQELVAAQRRLLQYTDLISSLYTELEMIRNIVCHDCKQRISLANSSAMASQNPIMPSVESHNIGSHQTASIVPPHPDSHNSLPPHANLPNAPLTTSRPASPMPGILSHSPVDPTPSESTPPTPDTPPTNETARPIIENSQWSVIYNSEIKRSLNITFVHAFKHTIPVYDVRFSPDGNFLVAGIACDPVGKVHIYDVNTKSIRCSLAEYSGYSYKKEPSSNVRAWCVCFSPDGRYLVVGGSFKVLYVWEIATKRVLATFKGHAEPVRSVDLSPNGRLLVSASYDCSVRIWKIRDGSSKLLGKGGLFASARFSPNGRYIVASDTHRSLRIWDVRSGQLVRKWNERIWCVAFSPDEEGLVSGSWGGMVKSWDVSSLKTPARSVEERLTRGGMLAQKNEKLKFNGHSKDVPSVSVSPDGKWVITGSSDKSVRIWDMHTAAQQCILEGHVDGLWSVDFSPVGNYFATGGGDGFVTLWGYQTV